MIDVSNREFPAEENDQSLPARTIDVNPRREPESETAHHLCLEPIQNSLSSWTLSCQICFVSTEELVGRG